LNQIVTGLWGLVTFLLAHALPWLGIIAWMAFWLFAVNWWTLRRVLLRDFGWIGVVLIGFVMVLVWGCIAPPESGRHYLLGLSVSNFVGKTVYVMALFCIMCLCGSVQLSGVLGEYGRFDEVEPEPVSHGHHDAHAGHHDAQAAHH
jgi:hypothetical protein